jgi:hypothetical protein
LKVDKNEAVISDFNNLFDIGKSPSGHKNSGKKASDRSDIPSGKQN